MTDRDREDERKNFLRLLNAAKPAPPAPALPSEPQDAWAHSEITPATSSYPLPATDVRSAAAGEQHDSRSGPTNIGGGPAYLPHYPASSLATPRGLAGADLLRMIQQGPPQSPAETSTHQRQSHQQQQQQQGHREQPLQRYQQQQQRQQYSASPSPVSAQRSVAEQQERFLKRCLDINDGASNNGTASPFSASSAPPPPPPSNNSAAAYEYPPAAGPPPPPPPPLPPAMQTTPQGHKRQNSKSRGQERGKGRNQRGGRGRGGGAADNNYNGGGGGGGGGGGYEPVSPAQGGERKRSATPGRGPSGKQGRGGQSHGATAVRETRKGKNGGGTKGGRGGGVGARAPATSPAYAWSSFQNSPDPKSIPIPSLKNLFLDGEASPRERAPGAAPPSLNFREEGIDWGGVGGVDDAGSAGLHTPPPPPERAVARTETESGRSSAKKVEDHLKKMLRMG